MMLIHTWLAWTSAPALFERSVICLIENMIDFTINTRKHGMGRENDLEHITKINFTFRD
jgi:predicted small integral membrane protein